MKSSEVYDAIEEIASTPSKLEKEALVTKYIQDADFLKTCVYAYDPFKNYYVAAKTLANVPAVAGLGDQDFDYFVWEILDNMQGGVLRGDSAVRVIAGTYGVLNSKSRALLERILLKDLRAGFGDSTINKARKGTIPTFPYMRCSLPAKSNMDKWDWGAGIISQEKADGMFASVNMGDMGEVEILSRQGSPFDVDIIKSLVREIQGTFDKGTQTHGELLVVEHDDEGSRKTLAREVGNGILNSVLSGGVLEPHYEVLFYAWDQIPLAEVKPKGKYNVRYATRLKGLMNQIGAPNSENLIRLIPTRIVKSKDAAYAHYREFLSKGKEGTVCKSPDAIWQDTTSKDQVKLKLEVTVELEVSGFNEGTGKYEGQLGSLKCESSCGKLKVDVSGRGDVMRKEVWENRIDWLGSIVSVKANSIMSPDATNGIDVHSLFLPIFIEQRSDKTEADSLESIQAQFKAAIAA